LPCLIAVEEWSLCRRTRNRNAWNRRDLILLEADASEQLMIRKRWAVMLHRS